MRLRAPRSLRSRLTLLVCSVGAVVIAALTVGFNLVLRAGLRSDADQVARERAESALETVAVGSRGRIRLIEAPPAQDAGGGVWVFDAAGTALERPPAPRGVQALADSLIGADGAFAESETDDVRLYARGVTDPGRGQVGTVVAALSVEPYERTIQGALIASAAFAAVMLAAVAGATRFLLGRALDPVAEMTRSATEWSEHDLDHRFAAGEPYDEITALAAGFDSMLDKLSASLRHEQRLTAEISHELRTPLTAIIAETELALGRPRVGDPDAVALERIAERAATLQRILESLLAAARAEGSQAVPATPLRAALEAVVSGVPGREQGRVRPHLTPCEPELLVDVEPPLLERIIEPILANACSYARSEVTVSAAPEGGVVVVTITDDGPGVGAEEAGRVFDPAHRGSQRGRVTESGSGLGLALSRRLARAAGGDVELAPQRRDAGATFEVRLPGRAVP